MLLFWGLLGEPQFMCPQTLCPRSPNVPPTRLGGGILHVVQCCLSLAASPMRKPLERQDWTTLSNDLAPPTGTTLKGPSLA